MPVLSWKSNFIPKKTIPEIQIDSNEKFRYFGNYFTRYSNTNNYSKKSKSVQYENTGNVFHTIFSLIGFDIIYIVFGCLCAALAGMGLPISLILSGYLTDVFVAHRINSTVGNSTYSTRLITEHSVKEITKEINEFGIWMAVVGSLEIICSYLMVVSLHSSARRFVLRLKSTYFKCLLKQDLQWFDSNLFLSFTTVFTENFSKIQIGLTERLGVFIGTVSNYTTSLIISLVFGWKLALILICLSFSIIIVAAVTSRVQSKLTIEETRAHLEARFVVDEALTRIRIVAAYGMGEKLMKKYTSRLFCARQTAIRKGLFCGFGYGISWFINYAMFAFAFWCGIKFIFESRHQGVDELLPSQLVIVLFCVILGSINVTLLGPYIEAINTAISLTLEMVQIISRKPPIDSSTTKGETLVSIKDSIRFKNVYFNYFTRPEMPVLNNININIEAGETVAIVGSNGSGKSTLFCLLQRLYDPTQGSIFIDDYDIRTLNVRCLREKIGVVHQEPIIFEKTIRENIEMGSNQNLKQDDIINAATAAGVHEFITQLPMQYDTVVGAGRFLLSGGQKQKIAIARALARKPEILLLDEATSALDAQSEAHFMQQLKLWKNVTKIIITHRVSAVRKADKIIMLNKGKVYGSGTHEWLFGNCEMYRKLCGAEMQTAEDANLNCNCISWKDDSLKGKSSESEFLSSVESQHHNSKEIEAANAIMFGKIMQNYYVITLPLPLIASGVAFGNQKFWSVTLIKEGLFARLVKLNSKDWVFITFACVGSLLFGCTTPGYALLFGKLMQIISITNAEKAMEETIFYSCLFLAIGAVAGISVFLQSFMFCLAGENLTMRIRNLVFRSILKKEMSWFDIKSNSSENLSAILATDASNLQKIVGPTIGILLQTCFSLLLSFALSLYFVWQQAIISILMVPVLIIAMFFENKFMIDFNATNIEAAKIATEAVNNIKTVASLCKENTFHNLYVKTLSQADNHHKRRIQIRGAVFGFSQGITSLSYALSLWYGGFLVTRGEALYEDVLKVGELLILGTMILGQTIALAPDYKLMLNSATRVFNILDVESDVKCNGKLILNQEHLDIQFDHVHFNYPIRPNVPILSDFCNEVKRGQPMALVGINGSGKSTCLYLLEGFYKSIAGNVLVGGKAIEELDLAWLRSQIGFVAQESILFNCSIFDNIAYGCTGEIITSDQVISAAQKANIHNFIISLPEGYNTNVGPNGTQLSGGQKQSIAIARALIRNPKILLLDEISSSLDLENEKMLQETLKEATIDRTTILITHNLLNISNQCVIAVLHEGKVSECGMHAELMQMKGHYYRLYKSQIVID